MGENRAELTPPPKRAVTVEDQKHAADWISAKGLQAVQSDSADTAKQMGNEIQTYLMGLSNQERNAVLDVMHKREHDPGRGQVAIDPTGGWGSALGRAFRPQEWVKLNAKNEPESIDFGPGASLFGPNKGNKVHVDLTVKTKK